MERKKRTNHRKGKTSRRKNQTSNTALLVCSLVLIVLMVAVYFQPYTGLLGKSVGGWILRIFGFLSYFVLPYLFVLSFFIGRQRFSGRAANLLTYIALLLICWGMILSADLLAVGDFRTVLSYGAYVGERAQGGGLVGSFFAFIIGHLIGRLGIYFLTALLAFFFILSLCEVSFNDFLQIMAGAFASLGEKLKGQKEKRQAKQEDKRLSAQEAQEAQQQAGQGERAAQVAKTVAEPSDPAAQNDKKAGKRKLPFFSDRKQVEAQSIPQPGSEGHRPITIKDYQSPSPKAQAQDLTPEAGHIQPGHGPAPRAGQGPASGTDAGSKLDRIPDWAASPDQRARHFQAMAPDAEDGPEAASGAGGRATAATGAAGTAGHGPAPSQQLDMETLGLSVEADEEEEYILPPLNLLKRAPEGEAVNEEALKQQALVIENTLASFGIASQVVSIQRGPTVTLFELKPQAGVKVSRITNLANDLALALAAPQIRIEAPIPGKPYVGIEVPNREKATVSLREILESEDFDRVTDGIPVGLGKSISGQPVISRMARMPHLLIAGATGSGKSVCINTIITSILYKSSPQEVRLILIDPKVVELSVYNGIPHLLIPVVTDPKKAAAALYMGVQEMERRFKLFSQYSVRDIQGWREKRKVEEDMENLPYIVIIIDELSDLMMVASKDVEAHITRLAQMARACGIHLIIATQRPSVDVITGTIKANIPSRISFAVSSSIDSRTILDQSGAEKLLGRGDMLYYPATFPKPQRVQGAFISDQEVSNIVTFIKDRHDPHYDKALLESIEKKSGGGQGGEREEGESDALMAEVLDFISHEETTSISGLQRRFRIGYARAGRIIDDLEAMGAVSAQDGSKPREVLIHADAGEEDPYSKGENDEYSE